MTRGTCLSGLLAALFWLPGYAVRSADAPPAPLAPPCLCPGVVFVVDGAGGFEAASRNLRQTVSEDKIPLEVCPFHWTHGYCRVLSDQVHASHIRREGRRLAELVLNCRRETPIYLVGHSAGCAIILIAAELLAAEHPGAHCAAGAGRLD